MLQENIVQTRRELSDIAIGRQEFGQRPGRSSPPRLSWPSQLQREQTTAGMALPPAVAPMGGSGGSGSGSGSGGAVDAISRTAWPGRKRTHRGGRRRRRNRGGNSANTVILADRDDSPEIKIESGVDETSRMPLGNIAMSNQVIAPRTSLKQIPPQRLESHLDQIIAGSR
ncbi:hypothetical protein PG999_014389 [Apiospora kogelbergensis]|uniref:Uncharacterized protein n=1 Tax=Apiospora kogelbergensis TaxID=1337665 RepID=A0AAW0Q8V3_9PEZI